MYVKPILDKIYVHVSTVQKIAPTSIEVLKVLEGQYFESKLLSTAVSLYIHK